MYPLADYPVAMAQSDPPRSNWRWAAGCLGTLAGVIATVAATVHGSDSTSPYWTSLPMYVAYAVALLAAFSGVCSFTQLPFPITALDNRMRRRRAAGRATTDEEAQPGGTVLAQRTERTEPNEKVRVQDVATPVPYPDRPDVDARPEEPKALHQSAIDESPPGTGQVSIRTPPASPKKAHPELWSRKYKIPATSTASRLHEAAGVFDRFAGHYAANVRVESEDVQSMLLPRLGGLQGALGILADAGLKPCPDEEFVVMARTYRDTAFDQVSQIQAILSQDEEVDSELLDDLVDSIVDLRDLIWERVPVEDEERPSRR